MQNFLLNCRAVCRSAQSLVLLIAFFAVCGCESPDVVSQSENEPSVEPSPVENKIADSSLEKEATANVTDLEAPVNEEASQEPSPAEAYLNDFDNPSKDFEYKELTATEQEKVAEGLRARFPFESIRDRMSFQMKEPSSNSIDDHRRRVTALRMLHSDQVAEFISNEGNGLSRFTPISPNDLKPYQHKFAKIVAEPVGSDLLSEPLIQLDPEYKTRKSRTKMDSDTQLADPEHINEFSPNGLPKKQLVSNFNSLVNLIFAGLNVGFVKSLDEVAGFEHHQLKLPTSWNQNLRLNFGPTDDEDPEKTHWKVNRIQLVSLLMHGEPVVYTSDELPNMKTLSSADTETRGLNAFEIEGLDKLKTGETVHVQATQNRIVMIGEIRASESCCQCHAVKTNSLLGAFSYEFLRHPRLTDFESNQAE